MLKSRWLGLILIYGGLKITMNEMFFVVCKDAVFLLLVTGLAVVVSKWFYKIYCGKRICTAVAFAPVEDFIYRLMRIDPDKEMNVKTYSLSVILFSVISIVFSTLILKFQNFLFLNPANVPGMSWHLAFNTAEALLPTLTGRLILAKLRLLI